MNTSFLDKGFNNMAVQINLNIRDMKQASRRLSPLSTKRGEFNCGTCYGKSLQADDFSLNEWLSVLTEM